MLQTSTTVDFLVRQFGGAHIVSIRHAGLVIGLQQQTSYNLVCKGRFPLPLVETNGKRMVRVVDIAAYLDSLIQTKHTKQVIVNPAADVVPACGKRGRPTRAEQTRIQAALLLGGKHA